MVSPAERSAASYQAVEPAVRPLPVPYDPELLDGLRTVQELFEPTPLRAHSILAHRAHFRQIIPSMEQQTQGRAVRWQHRTVPASDLAPEVSVTVIWPAVKNTRGASPAVLGIHGGGYVLGTRFFGTAELIELAEQHGTVGVAVEYRLAPEHAAPAAVEDCYAALRWLVANAAELGVDASRIVVSGTSAGGGLAAALALLVRDRGGPHLIGQLLNAPMIDDRNDTTSSWQYDGLGLWDRHNNDTGWNAVLGEDRGTDRVPGACAPARAPELGGLAPAFIEVGAAEVFRDETITYASRIWAAGGQAELHVWSGAYHGFASSSPEAVVSNAANAARQSWWRRILA